MRFIHKVFVCFLLCFLSTLRLLAAADDPRAGALSPEVVANFEWFDTLGFPDVHGCPAARVTSGWVTGLGMAPQESFLTGFLLRHDAEGHFTVLTDNMSTRTDTVTQDVGTPETRRVHFEEVPLSEVADACLGALENTAQDGGAAFKQFFSAYFPSRTEIFVWAWGCWRNGLDYRAARLYVQATHASGGQSDEPPAANFRETLEQDLGAWALGRATLEFANTNLSRPQLLEAFERITRNYPASRSAARASQIADMLRTMVAEDAAHAAKPALPLTELPVDQRVAEFIYRLRDETGGQAGHHSRVDLFGEYPVTRGQDKKEPGPAAQLAALGLAAVPQLLAAFDDPRFTRTIDYGNKVFSPPYVLTVGWCARQILARIAGQGQLQIWQHASGRSGRSDDAALKAQAEAWWQQVQQKGEEQVLVGAVSRGGFAGLEQAKLLQQRYPDAASEAMVRGARSSPGDIERAQFVALAGNLPGDAPMPFLKEELRGGRCLGERVAAAWALWRRGRGEEATAAMIADWEKLFPAKAPPGDGQNNYPEPQELIGFLADCGQVRAIQALGKDLGKRATDLRLDVVLALQPDRSNGHVYSLTRDRVDGAEIDRVRARRSAEDKARVQAAVEALLAAELEDTEVCRGGNVFRNGKAWIDPRVCDFAGETLGEWDRGKYALDLGGTPEERDRQRLACLNIWRGAHDQAALPTLP